VTDVTADREAGQASADGDADVTVLGDAVEDAERRSCPGPASAEGTAEPPTW
jgi:hypothetical protein